MEESFLIYFVQITAFLIFFSLFPLNFVPLSLRLFLGISLLIFLTPAYCKTSSCSEIDFSLLLVSGFKDLDFSYQLFIPSILVGIIYGIVASFSVYIAILMSKWISMLIKNNFDVTYQARGPNKIDSGLLTIVTSLIFLIVFTSTSGFSFIFTTFADSFPQNIPDGIQIIKSLGKWILLSAFIFALPIFVVSLVFDGAWIVANRFFSTGVNTSLIISVRYPLVLLTFSIILIFITAGLVELIEKAFLYVR